MTHHEHNTKTPRPGSFAVLTAFLRAKGTGAPETKDAERRQAHASGRVAEAGNVRAQATPPGGPAGPRRTSLGAKRKRGVLSVAAVVVLAAITVAGVAAAPALAGGTHAFVGSFGPCGPAPSACTASATDTFGDPQAIATDAEGDVYVYDNSGGGSIYKFNALGQPVVFLAHAKVSEDTNVIEGVGVASVNAVDELAISETGETKGDLYVANDTRTVAIYSSSTGEKLGELNEGVEPAGPWESACGVAVDPQGHVYVALEKGEHVDRFAPAGKVVTDADFTSALQAAPIAATSNENCELAVDAAENVYVNTWETGPVTMYTALQFSGVGPQIGVQVDSQASHPSTLAIDPATDTLFVDERSDLAEYELAESPARAGESADKEPGQLAGSFGVAAAGEAGKESVYARGQGGVVNIYGPLLVQPTVKTLPPSELTAHSATLRGSVNPGGVEVQSCMFEWGTSTAYEHKESCEEPVGSGKTVVEVTREITGLQPDTTYHYRLLASNVNGTNATADEHFTTPGPGFESESVAKVTNDSVLFQAIINPHSGAASPSKGAVEQWFFQYGEASTEGCAPEPGSCNTVPASPGLLPGETEAGTQVTEAAQGLAAGRTYHYRVVVVSQLGGQREAVPGPDHTFTTQPTGKFTLPDDRQWQLVSPPNKEGSELLPIREHEMVQAAADGSAIAYIGTIPTEADPVGYDNQVQVFSARRGEGWQTRDLTIPHHTLTEVQIGLPLEYSFFSQDLSRAAVLPLGPFVPCVNEHGERQACISEAASGQTDFIEDTSTGVFTPLESSCPLAPEPCPKPVEEAADLPPGTVTHSSEETCGVCAGEVAAATPDFGHVLIGLTEWSADEHGEERLRSTAILPDGLPAERAALGDGSGQRYKTRNAVSSDGLRVVFENEEANVVHLFMRENATQAPGVAGGCVEPGLGCTVQLDVGVEGGVPEFQTASSSGSRVFFTENGRLFVYEVQAAVPGPLEIASGVEGTVIGASEDGSYVYYVANGTSLYVVHNNGGGWEHPVLIATLSAADQPDWEFRLNRLSARVSSDGRWLAFMSQVSLTGYDNRDAVSGKPDEEVFLYHAAVDPGSEAGALVCASCNPSGERPHGIEYGVEGSASNAAMPLEGGDRVWPGTAWIAANVPGWTPYELDKATYQSRYLSDSGRLFFNSRDALVPKDVNGTGDVYEYEPQGMGPGGAQCGPGASSGSVVYEPARSFEVNGKKGESGAGCVSLISSGSSNQESAFLDASESGGDVFFLTSSKLVPADFDNALDVYDAHECTGESPCLPEPAAAPPACDTEASCKAAPSPQPPIYGASGTATFSGPGNPSPPPAPAPKAKTAAEVRAEKLARALKQCKKDRSKKRRARCEQAARKAYGGKASAKKSARGAGNDRRAGR